MPAFAKKKPEALKVETKDPGSGLGTGGMSTKILAARTASVSGGKLKAVIIIGLVLLMEEIPNNQGCIKPCK